jgi:hypothetical protein
MALTLCVIVTPTTPPPLPLAVQVAQDLRGSIARFARVAVQAEALPPSFTVGPVGVSVLGLRDAVLSPAQDWLVDLRTLVPSASAEVRWGVVGGSTAPGRGLIRAAGLVGAQGAAAVV